MPSGRFLTYRSAGSPVVLHPWHTVALRRVHHDGPHAFTSVGYEGALTAHDLVRNSVLLSVDEPGHISLGLNGCAGFRTGLYLADPAGYASRWGDSKCPSEGNWFEKAAGAPGSAGQGAAYRLQLMQEIGLRP